MHWMLRSNSNKGILELFAYLVRRFLIQHRQAEKQLYTHLRVRIPDRLVAQRIDVKAGTDYVAALKDSHRSLCVPFRFVHIGRGETDKHLRISLMLPYNEGILATLRPSLSNLQFYQLYLTIFDFFIVFQL